MIEWSMWRGVVLAWTAATLVVAIPAAAQEPPDSVPPDARRTVLDLKYVVEHVGGRVQDLQVRETDLEVRIELAADVLFDFDRAEIDPRPRRRCSRQPGSSASGRPAPSGLRGTRTRKAATCTISGCPSSGRPRSGPGWRARDSCLA